MTPDERAILQSQISRRMSGFRSVGKSVSASSEWFRACLQVLLSEVPREKRPRLVDAFRGAAQEAMSRATSALLASLVFQGVNDEPAKFLADFMSFESALSILDEAAEDLATSPPAQPKK